MCVVLWKTKEEKNRILIKKVLMQTYVSYLKLELTDTVVVPS